MATTTTVERVRPPEEAELDRKQEELRALNEEVAEQELAIATLRQELAAFEAVYLNACAARWARLDAIHAQLAASAARAHPEDAEARHRADEARAQAETSAGQARAARSDEKPPSKFEPTAELKKLFREAARAIHPDFASDPQERERRDCIMAEVNEAYAAGDHERLEQILRTWQASPDAVRGETIGDKLVRVIRQIASARRRLNELERLITELNTSELAALKVQADAAAVAGRDLIAEMAADLDAQVRELLDRLWGNWYAD
jgi:hypothetical protein